MADCTKQNQDSMGDWIGLQHHFRYAIMSCVTLQVIIIHLSISPCIYCTQRVLCECHSNLSYLWVKVNCPQFQRILSASCLIYFSNSEGVVGRASLKLVIINYFPCSPQFSEISLWVGIVLHRNENNMTSASINLV